MIYVLVDRDLSPDMWSTENSSNRGDARTNNRNIKHLHTENAKQIFPFAPFKACRFSRIFIYLFVSVSVVTVETLDFGASRCLNISRRRGIRMPSGLCRRQIANKIIQRNMNYRIPLFKYNTSAWD